MKYNRTDLIKLIDMAWKGIQADDGLKEELFLSEGEITKRMQILRQPDVLGGLEILFNSIYPRIKTEENLLLQVAENYPLEFLNLSARPYNILSKTEQFGPIRTVADLLRLSEYQISKIRGIGRNSKNMEEIKNKRIKFISDFDKGMIK